MMIERNQAIALFSSFFIVLAGTFSVLVSFAAKKRRRRN